MMRLPAGRRRSKAQELATSSIVSFRRSSPLREGRGGPRLLRSRSSIRQNVGPVSRAARRPRRGSAKSPSIRPARKPPESAHGAGGLVEQPYQFPYGRSSNTGGTPMCEALRRVRSALGGWIGAHTNAYPPTVLHVTDGESTDGDPSALAAEIRALTTSDGAVSLFNLHLSSIVAPPVTFPSSCPEVSDPFARTLFDMSSPLPERIRAEAAGEGYKVTDGSRGFAFNADLVETIRFIDIGTRVGNLR